MEFRRSLPMGSVRLTEKHVRSDPAGATDMEAIASEIAQHLANVPFPAGPLTLIGTAGTVTTLAAMSLGLTSYDPARVHGHRLTLVALEQQIQRLRASTQAERETMAGLDPKRADVVLAGACILQHIALGAQVPEILVSDRGIRWGLLFEKTLRPQGSTDSLRP
jgi:exopolyphosphatase/guanosine-5'-triphosphate,3'-diphosphate pyrophosphatase